MPSSVVGDVQVWRAAMQVSPDDRRPTGPVQLQKAARTWQRHLDRRWPATSRRPCRNGARCSTSSPQPDPGPFTPMLADRLAAISRAGVDARQLLGPPSPPAGRCPTIMPPPRCGGGSAGTSPQRSPPRPTPDHTLTTVRTTRLTELIGADRADTLQASRWWPALVTAVDHALQRGWRLDDLLGAAGMPDAGSVDAGQALVWRISLLADPTPTDEEPGEPPFSAAPSDPWNNAEPPSAETAFGARDDITTRPAGTTDAVLSGPADQDWVEPDLAVAALVRGVAGPPEQTDADVNRMFTRAMAWQECPISRDRMIEINQLALCATSAASSRPPGDTNTWPTGSART